MNTQYSPNLVPCAGCGHFPTLNVEPDKSTTYRCERDTCFERRVWAWAKTPQEWNAMQQAKPAVCITCGQALP